MDSSEGRHAALRSDKTREPLILPRRESAIGSRNLVAGLESTPGSDQVRNGYREIGSGRGAATETGSITNVNRETPLTPHSLNQQIPL
jgi:hypothetical protein